MKQVIPPNRGYDAVISINNIEVAGQVNASLSQETNIIDITNKINGEWEKSMAGTRAWTVKCACLNIKGAAAFDALQKAFNKGDLVDISLSDGDIQYSGKAIISSFPIVVNYNDTYTYSVTFKGVDSLNVIGSILVEKE